MPIILLERALSLVLPGFVFIVEKREENFYGKACHWAVLYCCHEHNFCYYILYEMCESWVSVSVSLKFCSYVVEFGLSLKIVPSLVWVLLHSVARS